uniref:UPAR/Ly6 domain-containing protein n=1 Tax=Strongyloides stercoralis TaxID=6248 RepID=A0A0K0ELA7_STRER
MIGKFIIILVILLLLVKFNFSIKCYTGTRYHVGQDEIQDVEECKAPLFTMDSYCYRFEADATVERVVKLGCASLLCSAIRNHCEQITMGPLSGKICCCNHNNFCNTSSHKTYNIFQIFIFILIIYLLTF